MRIADYTPKLKKLMRQRGITSFKSLAKTTGISLQKLQQLRRGNLQKFRLEELQQLSQGLDISLASLLTTFAGIVPDNQGLGQGLGQDLDQDSGQDLDQAFRQQINQDINQDSSQKNNQQTRQQIQESLQIALLRQEYQRLQNQMQEQRSHLLQEFQQTSLQTLETWLLQWERVANHARHHPEFSAAKILPLMRPIEQLIKNWGVEAIASLGAEVPYNPQAHRLQTGTANPGDMVKVQSSGYTYQGKLLHRAEVALISLG